MEKGTATLPVDAPPEGGGGLRDLASLRVYARVVELQSFSEVARWEEVGAAFARSVIAREARASFPAPSRATKSRRMAAVFTGTPGQ